MTVKLTQIKEPNSLIHLPTHTLRQEMLDPLRHSTTIFFFGKGVERGRGGEFSQAEE